MGSINSFSQAVQEILLNNYLKSNFENSEIGDFVPTFWKNPKKITTSNANILRTAYDEKIDEPILKSSH